MHQIRNNWLGPIFLCPRNIHTKGLLARRSWRPRSWTPWRSWTPIQKGDLCPLRLLSLIKEFSVIVPLQGIAPESSWLKDVSLKDCKIIWKTNEINEYKILLGDFNITVDKMDRNGGNKTQRLYRYLSKGPRYTLIKNC